ncbi:MAG: sulfotransferase [Bacteroidales bacterium]|nr:sulfotransferase [Bacteroidales bacterium]
MKSLFLPLITLIGKRIEKKKFTSPPVYIGGCGRSGTTLLLSMLSSHPEIFACPRELNIFEDALIDKNGKKKPLFYRLYRTLIFRRIKKTATRYCEKSPSNIKHIELMDKVHAGKFQLIQIIRDGRDVVLSRHPRKKEGFWVEPERWINDVKTGLRYFEHPNVHTLKYEDLVNDFKRTIEDICRFLNIPVSNEILDWHEHATVRQNNALFNEITKIHGSSIGKWKRPENKHRVAQLTKLPEAVKLLKQLKYTE